MIRTESSSPGTNLSSGRKKTANPTLILSIPHQRNARLTTHDRTFDFTLTGLSIQIHMGIMIK